MAWRWVLGGRRRAVVGGCGWELVVVEGCREERKEKGLGARMGRVHVTRGLVNLNPRDRVGHAVAWLW